MALDVAIDLGTSRTRIFLPNKGIVVDEPSVITIDLDNDGILAVGQEAYMIRRSGWGRSSITLRLIANSLATT